jgi:hypothetical protein
MGKYKLFKKISSCRICKNKNLKPVVTLGNMGLTGIFPKSIKDRVLSGPLELVKCYGNKACGLLQLKHSYDNKIIYGKQYGYQSSLNRSMVLHLKNIAENATGFVKLMDGDLVVDIGSNDGTLLNCFNSKTLKLIGIDPTANNFRRHYPKKAVVIPELFSSKAIKERYKNQKAKLIFSIAMFYDLDNPLRFTREVSSILDPNGVWVLEQSYLPSMIKTLSYDTICHEHLEYYCLRQFKRLFDEADLKIIAIQKNDTNGGSINITVAKNKSGFKECTALINNYLRSEKKKGFYTLKTYFDFNKKIMCHKKALQKTINALLLKGKTIFGYGASTKGNVILQYCQITSRDIPYIADVNKDKYGHITPCSNIQIIAQDKAHHLKPDFYLVMVWHYKNSILKNESKFLKSGGHFIFPLPKITVI